MYEESRAFFRLEDCVLCRYEYPFIKEIKKGEATVLDISGGGMKMVSKEFLKSGRTLNLEICLQSGPVKLAGEVIRSQMEWYVTDKGKETFCTVNVKFDDSCYNEKKKIIRYVHVCRTERNQAMSKKNRKEQ